MQNRINIAIFWICILAGFIGMFSVIVQQSNVFLRDLYSSGFRFGEILGIIYLIRNSDVYKTTIFRFFPFVIGILLTGVALNIVHWYLADQLLLLSYISMLVLYAIRFSSKQRIITPDFLKLLFVIFFLSGDFFTLFHWNYSLILKLFSNTLIIVIMAWYTFAPGCLIKARKKKTNQFDQYCFWLILTDDRDYKPIRY